MTLWTDTESALVVALDQSACEVFQMMAGVELTSISRPVSMPPADEVRAKQRGVTVLMGITGDLNGSVIITMSKSAACEWTGRMVGSEVLALDQTVIDAVGELGNIVVGGAKRRLSDFHLTMSLPSVLQDGIDRLRFSSKSVPLQRDYQFDEHQLSIVIALMPS
ncbi:chemotaxis protein CheX [Rubripirellula sp.]|nr:chemotaxis protein CheX [Rubripirellula sp.]MDF1844072.1 chemotaxis protein CheX [Rubripirellula sp.]